MSEHIHRTGDSYLVTGKLARGGGFSVRTSNPHHAFGINLWRGRVWLKRDGKRKLLKTVWN